MIKNSLASITENYVSWIDSKSLIAVDVDERHLYAAYLQGYVDALECLIAVTDKEMGLHDHAAVPYVYIQDLVDAASFEILQSKIAYLFLNRKSL